MTHPFAAGGLAVALSVAVQAQNLEAVRVVENATVDTAVSKIGGPATRAFWLPGIGTDFRFVVGGQLAEFSNGTARLTGVIARDSKPNERFAVDVRFMRRTNRAPEPPKLELKNDQYAPQGGVDPSEWTFYKRTRGILTGLGDFEGGKLKLTRRGPAFQMGLGASGYNALNGASSWINVEVLCEPSGRSWNINKGDININLDLNCPQVASAPAGDQFNQLVADQALWLDGIGLFDYVGGSGQFVERADGTATLTGLYVDTTDRRKCFFGNVTFTGFVGANDPAPAGSPKLLLKREAYTPFGGPADPFAYHYYTTTEGYLQGCGRYEGAVVTFDRKGEAFQVGPGASGMNVGYGAGGWLNVTVVDQPRCGPNLTTTGHGDINIDLGECPNGGGNDPIRKYGDPCGPELDASYNAGESRIDFELRNAKSRYGYVLIGLDEKKRRLCRSDCYLLVDYCQRICLRVDSSGERDFSLRLRQRRSMPDSLFFQYVGIDRSTWRYEASNGIELKLNNN